MYFIPYNTIQRLICRARRSQTSWKSGALDGSGPCYFRLPSALWGTVCC